MATIFIAAGQPAKPTGLLLPSWAGIVRAAMACMVKAISATGSALVAVTENLKLMTKLQSLIREMEYLNRIGNYYSCHSRMIEVLKMLVRRKRRIKK